MTDPHTRSVAPPGGQPPPERAVTPTGEVDLVGLAQEVCLRYREHYPDEVERYGAAGHEWCVHDIQHVLNWAIGDAHFGVVDVVEQTAWLGRILAARDFPVPRLAHSFDIAADVVVARLEDQPVATRLRAAADGLRGCK